MAHLWIESPDAEWCVQPLSGNPVILTAERRRTMRALEAEEGDGSADEVVLMRLAPTRARGLRWLLYCPPRRRVQVNGVRNHLGVRCLEDRDEIRLDGRHTSYFSTETLAEIVPFSAGAKAMYCGRCKQQMVDGEPALRCPGCGMWHHMTDELSCWSYADVCSACDQSTDTQAGYRWTPEMI